jgi:hypothetical protein
MNEFQAGYEQNKAAADNLRGKLDEMSFFVRQISFLPAHDEQDPHFVLLQPYEPVLRVFSRTKNERVPSWL